MSARFVVCMCVGAGGLSGEKGWGERAGGGQGKSQPGFALVFTTYWKYGPGKAAHILCSVLSALIKPFRFQRSLSSAPQHPAGVCDAVCGECRQMPRSMHWEWK